MENPQSPLLEAINLSYSRHDRPLFNPISFVLQAGEMLHIQGENGVGKTTLLRMLARLLPANTGTVLHPVHCAYLGHLGGHKAELTVRENCYFATGADTKSIEIATRQVGLDDQGQTFAHQLSAGQQRRLAWARVLLEQAKLWILDEPFTAVDHKGEAHLTQLIEQHRRAGGGVILTAHHSLKLASAPIKYLVLEPACAPA